AHRDVRHRPAAARTRGPGAGRGCPRVHVRRRGGRGRRVGRGCRMSSRRAARRTALFLLYQWDVTGQPLASLYEGEVDDFARETAAAVAAKAPDLDARITSASDDWTADRLGAIDEAVTLAKRYATDDAARLVNGILGRIVRERVT